MSHVEIESIGNTPETEFDKLVSFCMDKKGNLLACDADANMIRVISGEGETLDEWEFDFPPYSVVAPSSNVIYVAGEGVVVKLDKKGRITKKTESDGENFPNGIPSGITSTGKDVFVALGTGWSLRSRSSIVRFDKNLRKPEVIMEDLRGCCRRLDLTSKKPKLFGKTRLFIAENSRFRVLSCDRKGRVLDKWGKKDRTNIEDFATCCNPMNICFGPKGELYTAESGLGRIKRYTPNGEFRGLVGYVGTERFTRAGRTAASCSNITVAVNKDASRIYVLDFKGNFIRVMAKADAKTTSK
ncbi:MAG: NHL repeat-containing protein [Planctomycetota bacterium]